MNGARTGEGGQRWLLIGWLLVLCAGLPTVAFPGFFYGTFHGGPVEMRGWLWELSSGMRAVQLLGVMATLVGLWMHRRVASMAPVPLYAAAGTHGLSAALLTVGLAAPSFLPDGTWAPFGFEATLMRHLAFAPSLLLGVGLAACTLGIVGAPAPRRTGVALACVAAAGSLAVWFTTPQALVPRPLVGWVHPASALVWVVPVGCMAWGMVRGNQG